MCLAVPGMIKAINGTVAEVDFRGVARQALLDLLPEAQVGDYVLVHAGFAIQRMDATEAAEVIALIEEVEAAADPE